MYVCVCVCALLDSWSWWQDVEQEFIDAVKWLEGKGVSGITGISAESSVACGMMKCDLGNLVGSSHLSEIERYQ